jgi:uncharacterized protein
MRRHRLTAFFLLAFAISWGIPGLFLLMSSVGAVDISVQRHSPLAYLFFWGPALSALVLVAVTQGRVGIAAFAGRMYQGRYKWRWWTSVVIGVPMLKLLAYALADDAVPPSVLASTLTAEVLLWTALTALIESPVAELGWRGYALPLLQRHMSGFVAALVLGALWALWYIPWLLPGTVMNWSPAGDSIPAIVRFFAGTIALSVILTVVFNGSEGCIPLIVVYRWLTNPPHPWELGTHIAYVDTVITLTAAVILVFAVRRRYLARVNRWTAVTPGVADPEVVRAEGTHRLRFRV